VYEIGGITGSKLSANAPVCKIGGITGSKLSTNAPCVKLAALLVTNYPQMLLCMNLGTLLVAYYYVLSANYTITDMDKTSMQLQLHQYLLNIATKPLHHF
jgi:hypothetical protein